MISPGSGIHRPSYNGAPAKQTLSGFKSGSYELAASVSVISLQTHFLTTRQRGRTRLPASLTGAMDKAN
jgi:hypothetical protein